jgi:hypothetical protein
MTPHLRLGAFDVALDECALPHRELLESLFRVRAESLPADAPVHLRLVLGSGGNGSAFRRDTALECREENGRVHFSSDVVAAELEHGTIPCRLRLMIDETNPYVRHLDLYLRIVLNAVLRRLGRIRLHAAAVDFAGATSLFVGDKGTGKTTICLHLAHEGGTVLGEDQIMVRRSEQGIYLAAGGDDLMRLTAKTEAHFFPDPLAGPSVDVGGVAKKEIRARAHITYVPNGEYPLRRILFPEVGQTFAVRTVSRVETLRRLSAPLLPINRFTGDRDRRDFIDFLAGMTRQAECLSLTLTPDLSDLQQLSRFLA